MSDNEEVEVENPSGSYPVLPKEVIAEIGSIKLFNKWSYEDVEIRDISLTYVSHGRPAHFPGPQRLQGGETEIPASSKFLAPF